VRRSHTTQPKQISSTNKKMSSSPAAKKTVAKQTAAPSKTAAAKPAAAAKPVVAAKATKAPKPAKAPKAPKDPNAPKKEKKPRVKKAPKPIKIVTEISKQKSATLRDIPAIDFINTYALHLKKSGKVTVPKWADIVKTGRFKELAPYSPNWFYVRIASLARKVYLRGGIGVGSFRKIYGGAKDRGSKPSHFATASGQVIRTALKVLQKLNVVTVDSKGGRRLTSSGRRDLDRIATRALIRVRITRPTTAIQSISSSAPAQAAPSAQASAQSQPEQVAAQAPAPQDATPAPVAGASS